MTPLRVQAFLENDLPWALDEAIDFMSESPPLARPALADQGRETLISLRRQLMQGKLGPVTKTQLSEPTVGSSGDREIEVLERIAGALELIAEMADSIAWFQAAS